MNPEMTDPIGGLAGVAVCATLACAWVMAGGPRRIAARLAKRAGSKRRG